LADPETRAYTRELIEIIEDIESDPIIVAFDPKPTLQ
jgi:hypothetical protein